MKMKDVQTLMGDPIWVIGFSKIHVLYDNYINSYIITDVVSVLLFLFGYFSTFVFNM